MAIGIRAAKSDNKYGDGFAGKIGASTSGDAWCTLCGERGHKATAHAGGKAQVRDLSTAGEPQDSGGDGHGEAVEIDKATQYGYQDDTKYRTGSKNYELPGERSGKTIRIFG